MLMVYGIYKVQYEGLHIICATCGCYGHHTRNCNQKPKELANNGAGKEKSTAVTAKDPKAKDREAIRVSQEVEKISANTTNQAEIMGDVADMVHVNG